jgi:hypothetical protein
VLSGADRASVASAAHDALTGLGVTAVRLGEVLDGGGTRSVLMRAVAERGSGDPVEVVIKLAVGPRDRFVRERAALGLVTHHDLPGTVRLLGAREDPSLVVLEDLGGGPSVADLLLGDDPVAAEQAVKDWATTVGRLQAASTQLGDEFRARLMAASRLAIGARAPSRTDPPADLLTDWLSGSAETLQALVGPLGVRPTASALEELRAVARALTQPGPASGLVPGDTCPDNALYVDGRLTLIDFEGAAHRHVAWEAAHLLVPWPTCWCSWALPDQVASRSLAAWQDAVSPVIPQATEDSFADELAQAVIAWVFVTLTFLLPHTIREPATEPTSGSTTAATPRRRPDLRSLVLHRLQVAAAYPTVTVPALRALAGELHDACVREWGQHQLLLAPAFRDAQ